MSEDEDLKRFNRERMEKKEKAEELRKARKAQNIKTCVVIYMLAVMTSLILIGLGLKSLDDTVHQFGLSAAGITIFVSHVIILCYIANPLFEEEEKKKRNRYL
jgi:hypothetical protein